MIYRSDSAFGSFLSRTSYRGCVTFIAALVVSVRWYVIVAIDVGYQMGSIALLIQTCSHHLQTRVVSAGSNFE